MMRLRDGYILLALGLLALVTLTFLRMGRERQFYELQLRQQADSIEAGLRTKWKDHLLSAARSGQLPKNFSLLWNRTGKTMLTSFYPDPGIQLEWAEYRDAKKKNDITSQKAFLDRALGLKHSWDRVLALEEWQKLELSPEKDPRPGPAPEGFERTLLDPEAREAFRLIVSQFESGKDFTYVSQNSELDQVFFRLNENGELEGSLPAIASLKDGVLAQFKETNRLSSVEFGSTVLDVRFPQFQNIATQGFRKMDTLLLTASVILLMAGVWLTASRVREQRKSLNQRVTFLNQVVHELKTPLAGLKLNAQLIGRSGASEKNLQAILTSIGRLDRLFDDIVQINRAEKPAELGRVSAAELNTLLQNLCEVEFPKRASCETSATQDLRCELGRLRVLLRNLISNGVKYGDTVTITILESHGITDLKIKDRGPGVSTADAGKIFDEFYRAESARRVESDGLGLGLSLVRKLARELDAEVQLLNPGERGALFSCKIKQMKSEDV
jgi:signal transduction histidine kinase